MCENIFATSLTSNMSFMNISIIGTIAFLTSGYEAANTESISARTYANLNLDRTSKLAFLSLSLNGNSIMF